MTDTEREPYLRAVEDSDVVEMIDPIIGEWAIHAANQRSPSRSR